MFNEKERKRKRGAGGDRQFRVRPKSKVKMEAKIIRSTKREKRVALSGEQWEGA